MKTLFKAFSLVALLCAFVNLAAQQTREHILLVAEPVKPTDENVARALLLPAIQKLTIDTDNIHEVHDDGTGKGCIILPIKLPIPTKPENRNAANYAFVFYNLKNFDENQVVQCHTNGSRDAAGKPTATIDLLDAASAKLVNFRYQNNDLRIQTTGTTQAARSYGDCVDGNYSGAKGAFAGAAAGACLSANIFACAASAGYLAGTLLGCALK